MYGICRMLGKQYWHFITFFQNRVCADSTEVFSFIEISDLLKGYQICSMHWTLPIIMFFQENSDSILFDTLIFIKHTGKWVFGYCSHRQARR